MTGGGAKPALELKSATLASGLRRASCGSFALTTPRGLGHRRRQHHQREPAHGVTVVEQTPPPVNMNDAPTLARAKKTKKKKPASALHRRLQRGEGVQRVTPTVSATTRVTLAKRQNTCGCSPPRHDCWINAEQGARRCERIAGTFLKRAQKRLAVDGVQRWMHKKIYAAGPA